MQQLMWASSLHDIFARPQHGYMWLDAVPAFGRDRKIQYLFSFQICGVEQHDYKGSFQK